jgi:hypothetical protein
MTAALFARGGMRATSALPCVGASQRLRGTAVGASARVRGLVGVELAIYRLGESVPTHFLTHLGVVTDFRGYKACPVALWL